MSKDVARWDKISFLEAVRVKFGEEYRDVSKTFIDQLDKIYDITWSPKATAPTPRLTAIPRLTTKYRFLEYGAETPYIYLKIYELDRDGYPFHNNRKLFVDHFKGLYNPNDATKDTIKVHLATLKSPEQFELFMQRLSRFEELVEFVSKGEDTTMRIISTDSEHGANYSEERYSNASFKSDSLWTTWHRQNL